MTGIRDRLPASAQLSPCLRSLALRRRRADPCGCTATPSPSIEPLTMISVRACFDGKPPRTWWRNRWTPPLRSRSQHRRRAQASRTQRRGAQAGRPARRVLRVLPHRPVACREAHERGGEPAAPSRPRPDHRPRHLVLAPAIAGAGRRHRSALRSARGHLGLGALAAGARLPDGARAYRVGHSPYDWPAKVVFGHFQEHGRSRCRARVLRVAVLEGSPPVEPGLRASSG